MLVALAVLVALLVGGRWVAVETAERAWAASLGGGGTVYLATRDLARLLHGLILLVSVAWGVANFYYVYRAIGSVQLPRRLGDLEIVEAVPQRTLLAGAIGCGLVYGLLLALGTGRWWLVALLDSRPPHFGIVDPVLQRDLGFYLGQLPWAVTTHRFALQGTATALLIVGLLYLGIGSLRFSRWRPTASAHARSHLGLLLALLAITLARGAALDPAEVVAGLHGVVDRGALVVRIPGAPLVAIVAVLAALASLVWGLRERTRLLGVAWGAVLVASLGVYLVLPSVVRGGSATAAARGEQLERLAFGAQWREGPLPHGFASVAAAVARLPVWDADRAAALARRAPSWSPHAHVAGAAFAAPSHGALDSPARWIVVPAPDGITGRDSQPGISAPAPDWGGLHRGPLAHAGRPIVATEVDSGLALASGATRDSAFWFGPAFREFAVAAPDTWPGTRVSGIPLSGGWRRTALAWVLQSPELARRETDGLMLLWRRDVVDRLSRLAPFARFATPTPAFLPPAAPGGGALVWLSYGYVASTTFPLARPLEWPGSEDGESVRYARVALVGLVDGANGSTRLYLAPGADSLAAAWARVFAPLILPADSIPPWLRDELPYPHDAFRLAALELMRIQGDSGSWRPRPREPYELTAPADEGGDGRGAGSWLAQGFETGSPGQVAGLLAATMSASGPSVSLWHPVAPIQFPAELLGSSETAPGVLRLWMADGSLVTEQGLFLQPASTGAPKGLSQLYLTWGDRSSNGPTAATALHNLLTAGTHTVTGDTSLAGRWEAMRRLAAAADSALAAGDLERFGRLYGEVKRLLGIPSGRLLAPSPERR